MGTRLRSPALLEDASCRGKCRLSCCLGILAVIAFLFFQVMAVFALPLFLAVLLVVMFRPMYLWIVARCGNRERLAPALTTMAILLIFLIPMLLIFFEAGTRGVGASEATQLGVESEGRNIGR